MKIIPLILCLGMFSACGGQDEERPWPTEFPPNPEDGNHFDSVSDPFYEGWYHKVALPQEGDAFFFIYGVINPMPGTSRHSEAFVYCGRQKSLNAVYQTFPAADYSAATGYRDVRIGEHNRACALRFKGRLDDGTHSCRWDIDLQDSVPWLETMGWLTGAENLETSWTVGTITARASGKIEFDGEEIEFADQKGYCDHNWGTVFPEAWVWMQANDFPGQQAALAASGGTVNLLVIGMEASMIGLFHNGEMATFRTQDLDVVDVQAEKGHWSIAGQNLSERITIEATCKPDDMFHLLVPSESGMQPHAWESLKGHVNVTLERREGLVWQEVFSGSSPWAGVEVGE